MSSTEALGRFIGATIAAAITIGAAVGATVGIIASRYTTTTATAKKPRSIPCCLEYEWRNIPYFSTIKYEMFINYLVHAFGRCDDPDHAIYYHHAVKFAPEEWLLLTRDGWPQFQQWVSTNPEDLHLIFQPATPPSPITIPPRERFMISVPQRSEAK